MVCSVLLCVLHFKTILWWILIGCWKSPTNKQQGLKGHHSKQNAANHLKGQKSEDKTGVWLFVPFCLTYFSVGQVVSQPCTGLWQQLRTDQTPHCVHSRESTFNLENKLGLYVGLRGHTMTVIWGPFRPPPHCVQRVHDDRTFGAFFTPPPRLLRDSHLDQSRLNNIGKLSSHSRSGLLIL